MTKVRLTRRGEIVVSILAIIAFFALWGLADYITTPEVCRVPFEQMSDGCKAILYP